MLPLGGIRFIARNGSRLLVESRVQWPRSIIMRRGVGEEVFLYMNVFVFSIVYLKCLCLLTYMMPNSFHSSSIRNTLYACPGYIKNKIKQDTNTIIPARTSIYIYIVVVSARIWQRSIARSRDKNAPRTISAYSIGI